MEFLFAGRSGGICDKQRVLKGGIAKSANTGLVSFTVYNRVVSSVVSHLTFAHELGHSMGSPVSGIICSSWYFFLFKWLMVGV